MEGIASGRTLVAFLKFYLHVPAVNRVLAPQAVQCLPVVVKGLAFLQPVFPVNRFLGEPAAGLR